VSFDSLLCKLLNLGVGEAQDLVDVFESVRVAAQREVDERDAESGDILDRKVRPGLSVSGCEM
jgi:hypothetical protein